MKWRLNKMCAVLFLLLSACSSSVQEEDIMLERAMRDNMKKQTFLMSYGAYKMENFMRGTTGSIAETFASVFVKQTDRIYKGDNSVTRDDLLLDSLKTLLLRNNYHEEDSIYLKEPVRTENILSRQTDLLNYTLNLSMRVFYTYSSMSCGWWFGSDTFQIIPSQRKGYYCFIAYEPATALGLELEVHTENGIFYPPLSNSGSSRLYTAKIPLHTGIRHIYWTDSTRGYDRTFDLSEAPVKRVYRSSKNR